MQARTERPAVFFDRDGTVIHNAGYPRDPRKARLLPGRTATVARLRRERFARVPVSNQSCLARGQVSAAQAEVVQRRVTGILENHGVRLDAAYYCPHPTDADCPCWNPSPVMLLQVAGDLGLDPSRAFMVGDMTSDVEVGRLVGCRTVLLERRAMRQREGPSPNCVAGTSSDVLN